MNFSGGTKVTAITLNAEGGVAYYASSVEVVLILEADVPIYIFEKFPHQITFSALSRKLFHLT